MPDLSNPKKRLPLSIGGEIHAHRVRKGLALCYRRRNEHAGIWSVRYSEPGSRRYRFKSLGAADDLGDGISFTEALALAASFKPSERQDADFTVAQALHHYVDGKLAARDRPETARPLLARQRVVNHRLGSLKASTFDPDALLKWRDEFVAGITDERQLRAKRMKEGW